MTPRILERIGQRIHDGTLELVCDDGQSCRIGSSEPLLRLRVHDKRVFRRLLLNPRLAFGEAYIRGDLQPESANLEQILAFCIRNVKLLAQQPGYKPLARVVSRLKQINNPLRSQAHVSHHYDKDFDLYRSFLDADLHYSCAYFTDESMSLEEAQQAKTAHIAAKLDLRPGQKVLDIGSGWGSLAMYLAEHHGVHCTGVTLSEEQLGVARKRARERRLENHVEFQLKDYRTLDGQYDAVVSVGMFEHVGVPQFQTYFDCIDQLLKEDGTALVHTIGRNSNTTGVDPWISKYIFPGAYIPAASEILAAIENTALINCDLEVWRLHYAHTLEHWNERFQQKRDHFVQSMGEEFCRMWEFYLQSCAAAFRHGELVVFQIQLTRSMDRLPVSRDYLYTGQSQTPASVQLDNSMKAVN